MGTSDRLLSACGIVLDVANRQAFVNGTPQRLTPKECRLLEVFMRHPGETLSRAFLMREVWETDYVDDTRTLEVHVCTLRKKLALSEAERIKDPSRKPPLIQTIYNIGYRFGD